MENHEAWENYKEYTRDVTELSRKLAFAGIAIIWVIKPADGVFGIFSLLSLVLIIAYFLADVAQYLAGARQWHRWINLKEEEYFNAKGSIEGDYSPPVTLDKPALYLFWIKVSLLILGFIFLWWEIVSRFV